MNSIIKEHIARFTKYLSEQVEIMPLPKVVLRQDSEESDDFLGKTAYYDPTTCTVVLYTAGRHPKDVVRSYAHEMIHHYQNLQGRLQSEAGETDPKYAQTNKNLRKIEAEAYMKGNMFFRDYCDNIKYNVEK